MNSASLKPGVNLIHNTAESRRNEPRKTEPTRRKTAIGTDQMLTTRAHNPRVMN